MADPSKSAYNDFAKAAIKAGRTANGVFAARIMWGTMDELVLGLTSSDRPSDEPATTVLGRVFGPLEYVYLRREDIVAQAVSLLIAEQTQLWHQTEERPGAMAAEPSYNFEAIKERVQALQADNRAWEAWFTANGVMPHRVVYSDLERRPEAAIQGILNHLGVALPRSITISTPDIRLAREINRQWISRYQREDDGDR